MVQLKGKTARTIFEAVKKEWLPHWEIALKTGLNSSTVRRSCEMLHIEGFLIKEGDNYHAREGVEERIEKLLKETKSRNLKQLGLKINILESKIAVPIIEYLRENGPSKGMDIAEGNEEHRSNTYMYLGYLRKYGFVKKEGQLNVLQEDFIRHFNKEVDDFQKWLNNK